MKYYITKYALTKGIFMVDTDKVKDLKVTVSRRRVLTFSSYIEIAGTYTKEICGADWFENEQEAIADAIRKRESRIALLNEQIQLMNGINFNSITPIRRITTPASYLNLEPPFRRKST